MEKANKNEDQEQIFEGDGEEMEAPFEFDESCFKVVDQLSDEELSEDNVGVQGKINSELAEQDTVDDDFDEDDFGDEFIVLEEADVGEHDSTDDQDVEKTDSHVVEIRKEQEREAELIRDEAGDTKDDELKATESKDSGNVSLKGTEGEEQKKTDVAVFDNRKVFGRVRSICPKLRFLMSIPRCFRGPCFEADSFRFRVTLYPVSHFDLQRPELASILTRGCTRSFRLFYGVKKHARRLEVCVQNLKMFLDKILFCIFLSDLVIIEVEERKRVGNDAPILFVPIRSFGDVCNHVHFNTLNHYTRLALEEKVALNADESLEQRTLYIDNLPSSVGKPLLRALFPRSTAVHILENSDGKSCRSAEIEMNSSQLVYDHLVAFTKWSINGTELDLRMHDRSQIEVIRDVPKSERMKALKMKKFEKMNASCPKKEKKSKKKYMPNWSRSGKQYSMAWKEDKEMHSNVSEETRKDADDRRNTEAIPYMGWKRTKTKKLTEDKQRREEGRLEKERSWKTDRFQRLDMTAGETFRHQARPREFDHGTISNRMKLGKRPALELQRSQERDMGESESFRQKREMGRQTQESTGQEFFESERWHQRREQEPHPLTREDTMHRTKPSMHQQREHESGIVRFPQGEDRRRQPLEQRKRRREEPRRQESEELGQFSSKRSRSDSYHWARTAGQAFEPMTEHHEQMDRRQQGPAGVVPMPGDEQPLHTLPKACGNSAKESFKMKVFRQAQELQKNLAFLGKIEADSTFASRDEIESMIMKSYKDIYPGDHHSVADDVPMQGNYQQTAYQEPYNAAVNLPYQQPYNDANQQSFMGDTSRSKDVTTTYGSLYNKEEKPWHRDNYGNNKGNEKGKYNKWQQDQDKAQRSNNRERQLSQTDRSLHGQQGYGGQQQGHQGYGGRQQDQMQSVGQFQNQTQFGSRYEAEPFSGRHEAKQAFGGRHEIQPTFGSGGKAEPQAFGGGHNAQQTFGGGLEAQPAFGGGHGAQQTFGDRLEAQPTFGSQPNHMWNQNMYEGQQQQYGEYDQQQYGEYNQQQQYGAGLAQQQYIDKSQGQSQWFGGRAQSQPQYGGRFGGHQQ